MDDDHETPESKEEHQEARAYWGQLLLNARPSTKLDRLLRAIAKCILAKSKEIEPHDGRDLLPHQLAAFYSSVGGDYDPLFLETPYPGIAFIYSTLGCLHSLQPNQSEERYIYKSPSIPALKPEGFIRWQTIQLLLGPQQHVPFIQNALKQFDVVDPIDGKAFPKTLPSEAFPSEPDQNVQAWHDRIASGLSEEAQQLAQEERENQRHSARPRAHTESSMHSSVEERTNAARYFGNPLYKREDGRPTIVRRWSKPFPHVPKFAKQGGKVVSSTLRNFVNPHLWAGPSRRPSTERAERRHERSSPSSELVRYEDRSTPTPSRLESQRMSRSGSGSHHRHRSRSPDSVDSRTPSPHSGRRPVLRHHRSHDPPGSLRTPQDGWGSRRSSADDRPPPAREKFADYGPSESPPFAAKVASGTQAPNTEPRRPSYDPRDSGVPLPERPITHIADRFYDRPAEAYYRRGSAPDTVSPTQHRRGRSGTDIHPPRQPQQQQHPPRPVNGVSGRRYPDTSPWGRETPGVL